MGLSLAMLVGCSDNGEKNISVDTIAADFTVASGDGAKAENYPAGPYGTRTGEVAANLEFMGFLDPKNFCKGPADKKMDKTRLTPISFRTYYEGDKTSACAKHKPKLMWIMVSAGWCQPCWAEVTATQKEYGKGSIAPGLELLNIVFETKTSAPATEAFLKTWADQFSLTFPVAMDPSFKMGAYFTRAAVPFNMLIETKTMKIYYQQVGGSLSNIGKKASEYFANNK